MMRAPLIVLLVGLGLGACAALVTMWAAWEHNPQGEFHDDSAVHVGALASVGASWFAVVALPFLVGSLVWALARRR